MIFPWQSRIWSDLRNRTVALPHALLIHGPAGIGKLALAEHFAQSLLCEAKDVGKAPCGACEGCRWVIAGSHPDFRLVQPESLARPSSVPEEDGEPTAVPAKAAKPSSELKVDQIRALDAFLGLRSHRGGRRIVLVHPAEAMNANAANALLKALEEPPAGAFFLLVSHRPANLLPTIRSRCVAIPVATPDRVFSEAWLSEQGVKDPGRWLAFSSGAPLLAKGYAEGSGETMGRLRDLLKAGDRDALGAVNDRDQLEALAEVLQKYALDVVFASYCGESRYGEAMVSRDPVAWVRYARLAGRNRRLAGHPLNPRLFAGEMISAMPKD